MVGVVRVTVTPLPVASTTFTVLLAPIAQSSAAAKLKTVPSTAVVPLLLSRPLTFILSTALKVTEKVVLSVMSVLPVVNVYAAPPAPWPVRVNLATSISSLTPPFFTKLVPVTANTPVEVL